MAYHLPALRQTPQIGPERYLRHHPGCWVQYYDDTPARDLWKSLSAPTFDPEVAARKQQAGCAVAYSLQAFGRSRTSEGLLSFRNLGVDVDFVAPDERASLAAEEIDRRKQAWLDRCLFPFPLQPHWLSETRHGVHAVWRILPLREPARVREAQDVNRRLVRALRGDEKAALLTQVLRVPGTFQFKGPRPFLCRLLLDNAAETPPHDVRDVRTVLDAWEAARPDDPPGTGSPAPSRTAKMPWRSVLAGVAEGGRNAAAAALAGAILCRVPEYLWEAAGWGGLKEWNLRNPVPLPERELRQVFESITRRERAARRRATPAETRRHEFPSDSPRHP